MFRSIKGFSGLFKVAWIQKYNFETCRQPQHLICFKRWTKEMIMNVIKSAIALKKEYPQTGTKKLKFLKNYRIMVLSEVNEPMLIAAVTNASIFLGADTVHITDKLMWDHDYNGKIFSFMADAIFVSTSTHTCVERLAFMSVVPVMCMMSRTNASLQALAILMTIIEEFGTIECQKISYIGQPKPILNSLMFLSTMLNADIRMKCCSKKKPMSPLLLKVSQDLAAKTGALVKVCSTVNEALLCANIIIAGPTARKQDIHIYHFDNKNIADSTTNRWIFIHCCPRGKEVNDLLFYGRNARTFNAFNNLQYIAAALMAFTLKQHLFCPTPDDCC